MTHTGRNMGGKGPKVPTPLTLYFYREKERSGITLRQLADATGLSISMVGAVINGTRGDSQERSVETIRAIASALGLDPDEAERLSGIERPDEFVEMVRRNPILSRAQKEELLEQY